MQKATLVHYARVRDREKCARLLVESPKNTEPFHAEIWQGRGVLGPMAVRAKEQWVYPVLPLIPEQSGRPQQTFEVTEKDGGICTIGCPEVDGRLLTSRWAEEGESFFIGLCGTSPGPSEYWRKQNRPGCTDEENRVLLQNLCNPEHCLEVVLRPSTCKIESTPGSKVASAPQCPLLAREWENLLLFQENLRKEEKEVHERRAALEHEARLLREENEAAQEELLKLQKNLAAWATDVEARERRVDAEKTRLEQLDEDLDQKRDIVEAGEDALKHKKQKDRDEEESKRKLLMSQTEALSKQREQLGQWRSQLDAYKTRVDEKAESLRKEKEALERYQIAKEEHMKRWEECLRDKTAELERREEALEETTAKAYEENGKQRSALLDLQDELEKKAEEARSFVSLEFQEFKNYVTGLLKSEWSRLYASIAQFESGYRDVSTPSCEKPNADNVPAEESKMGMEGTSSAQGQELSGKPSDEEVSASPPGVGEHLN